MSDLRERIARLSPEARARLEAALISRRADRASDGEIAPRSARDQPVPLSFGQERLWFLHQLDPRSPLHNLPWAVRLRGPLDRAALQRALDALLARHEVLRTRFAFHDGAPVQLITPLPASVPLSTIDLRAAPLATRDAELERHLRAEAARPFDLARDILFRATVLELAPDDATLLLVTHHIASDGWSLGILFDELAALYEALSRDHPSPLPELPLQYADYALWQRHTLQGPALKASLTYWTQQLTGVPPFLDLPTDRPRPPAQTYRGARHPLVLPAPIAADLHALSRRHGVTLFMTLLAAFQTLLHRVSGQTDIVVASPIAGRIRPELEPLVGIFVNTLALRTSLADDPSFGTLLARVRQISLAAFEHQSVPFERIVEELRPARSLGHAPLVQVMFVLQNTAPVSLSLPGLTATPVATDTGASEFDLALFLRDTPDGLRGVWQYNSDLFDAPTIARLAGHFRTLLESIVADPDQRLSVLPLLTAAERHQLLVEWNATGADYPHDLCLHRLVEAQVARTPDAVALVWSDQSLTYRQLNARANQLAHHLQGLGVGPEVLVGVCLERSPDLVIALLAILKAGAAYLPLDPAYPRQRLAFMLEDAQVPVVLTHQHLLHGLPACAARVVCLDTAGAAIGASPTTNPASPVRPDQLAYVIYTSGSTGQPKGVLGLHRGTLNRFHWMYERYPFAPDDVCCQKTSVNFVDSVWEIFGPLAHGVPLVIIPDDVLQDPAQLVEVLAARRVTRLLLVPSLLRMILETDLDLHRRLPHLRWWISSGEALSVDLVATFRQRLPQRTLLNLYGSSEASADCTFHEIPPDEPLTSVPIGRPIANTQLYVLDAHQHPVPIGVPGELYIGGVGLARGYLNRPALTAETFVPHLFSDEAGARLYKTGDRVRYRPDGALLYLGRLDQQVKLRGVRIELGELEATLAQHPSVQHAVAALRDDPAGDPCLVAYLVAHPTTALAAAADLRDYLRQTLPGYMLPAAFVPLAALPLTPSGKVDRAALPAPSPDLAPARPDFTPPSTPTEQLLAQIWADLLGVPHVSVHDNFFDLGGHSLLALRVFARLREALGTSLPVRALFEAPTVAHLAALISARPADSLTPIGVGPAADSGRIARRADQGPAPLSFAQQRLWFLHQLAPESPLHNLAFAVRLQGPLDRPALQHALDAFVDRHHALRTTFAFRDGAPVQLVAPPRPAALAVIDLQTEPPATRDSALQHQLADQARRLFDLAQDLLLRAVLIHLAPDQCVLLLVTHHIAADGWSLGILFQDLAVLYEAFAQGRPSPLPPLPLQYADYAVWQRQVLTGPALATQRAYWTQQLASAPTVLELPADRPRPAVQSYRGAQLSFTLPAPLTRELNALSRREDVTLFMTLLAAFQTLLHRVSGQTDIVVASPIAGRTRRELEPLVGVFVNTLALRTSLADDPSFRTLLARVRHVTLGAFDHPDLPFELLVEELHPQRSLGHAPLAQVMFVLQNTAPVSLTLPGLTATPVATDTGASEFDLALFLRDTPDGLRGFWQYNSDLFDAPTIARLAGHFRTLLHGIVADPSQPLSVVVPLPTLPLTPSGKIDRTALPPTPELALPDLATPTPPTEQLLAQIWADLLGLPHVGVHDNFFDLGGHSLLALRMLARLREALGASLPVRALFQAPTVAQLAALLASHAADPPALIAGRPGAEQGRIPRRFDDGPCALSFAQQRLWFLHQLAPESPLHNLAFAVRLRGSHDRPALQQALDTLVDRHHALRTTFAFHAGAPVQLIAPPRPAALAVIDLQTEPPPTRDSALQHHVADQARRLFDLTQDLLLRAVLIHLAPDECVLLLVLHHIAADGWSLGVLFQDLAALYEAFAQGRSSPLPPLPLQYADYAVWQRQVLTGPALAAQRAYWTQQLAGAPTVLDLPADRPRPAVQSYRGAQLSFTLPAPLTRELNALSRREDVTLFMTLLAAFQTLLHRVSGQTDIVVASPIAGRPRRELEPLVGVFVNTLALRTSLADDPSFGTLLARVRHVTLGAFDHPDLPFELLVEELRPQRSLGHAPLVQVMFVLQNTAPVSLALPGLTATPVATDTGASEFDLALFLRDTPDGLRGVWQYNSDLFDAPTIARLAGHFRTLLESIVADPDQRLSVLPLLTAAERQQLLVEWNATGADYPHDLCLHRLVEAQVARTPDAVALVWSDQSLTYRQLNARANQLAHHLQGLGVGPEVLVGVCLERSPDLVIALLAILKAGAAYLPLDPAYPRQRLAFMLEDAQVPVVLTHQSLLHGLPACAARVVCLDTAGAAIGASPTTNPASPVRPDQLAYVIYTSGSTGQPKGVLGLHRGTLNRFHWMYERYPFAPDDVCCQKTSVNFVDSVWEIFGPLAHGIPLVIIPDDVLQDPAQLVEVLAARRVTRLLLVPSLLRMILETDLDLHRRLPHLRWWISSGEALSVDLVATFRQRLPQRTLLNLYGSSEASADCTFHEIPPDEPLTSVPIGRPIANTQLYVLDAHQHPVPIGVPGELYIGGVGLARGYLNRPALTAETFVPHLFSDEAGARLYKTGDRVRYRPDGALLYLGRLDQQVKLRGVRIELGELEATLAQHPSVQHAVATLRDDPAGDPCLVAYLVAHPTTALAAAADLRDYLRQTLPSYMLPAAFVPLAALPLTPSGKVDRAALPAPSAPLPGPDTSPLPRTPTERLIARIWCEALAVDTVTVDDSFFDLGGHSLLAIQVLQRIEKATGIKGQPTALFVRTLGQLASDYDERQTAGRRPLEAGLLRRLMARIRGHRHGA